MNYKQIDSYSILICAKYLISSQDFINIMCVNSKFKETTEKLRFNPIPITSLKLFPKIQTQYLYSKEDMKIEGIDNYEIWHDVDYDQYLQYNRNNVMFHNVIYTHDNRIKNGDSIPKEVNVLGKKSFGKENVFEINESKIKKLTIPSSVKSLGTGCFYYCSSLISINLSSTITSLGNECFYGCSSLTLINLSTSLTSISIDCFNNCSSLQSIVLPCSLISLSESCFCSCTSLSSINIPSSLTEFGTSCFNRCSKLVGVINVPQYCFVRTAKII